MNARFWEADDPPDSFKDWVNENVIAALDRYWVEEPPGIVLELRGDDLIAVIVGPMKPDEEGKAPECYTVQEDLMECVLACLDKHDDRWIRALRKFAAELPAKLDEIEKQWESED